MPAGLVYTPSVIRGDEASGGCPPGAFAFKRRFGDGAGRAGRQGDQRPGGAQGCAQSGSRRGDRVRPPLVHGHRRASEELRGHAAGARGRARRRHGLRRIVDHGLQRDRGVGHGRHPRPVHLPADAERWSQGRPHDLRRRHSGRRAIRRATRATSCDSPSSAWRAWASTRSTSGPSSSTSSSSPTTAPRRSTRAATSP